MSHFYITTKQKNTQNNKKSLPRSIRFFRETSRYASFCCGSLTVEAALILPFAICFFVWCLFFFRILQVQIEVQKALNDTARMLAVYLDEEEENHLKNLSVTKVTFAKQITDRKMAQRYIQGGISGISFLKSDLSGDEICLHAAYKITFPVRILPVPKLQIAQSAECRKWIGWRPKEGEGDGPIWVYIAETGTVYHMTRSCTYLTLSIQSVLYEEVLEKRNESGEKYRKCVICYDSTEKRESVYITNYGDCYHRNLDCSGIKRTIYAVRISEVGERRRCGKCGRE